LTGAVGPPALLILKVDVPNSVRVRRRAGVDRPLLHHALHCRSIVATAIDI
jgi:hypothetical protein